MEDLERHTVFRKARAHADRLGVPLVNYGCRISAPFVQQSDLNLDIVHRNVPRFRQIPPDGDIPLPDNSAVVFASHVLEHTYDPEKVLREMRRVGPTYVVLPKWWDLANWIHPGHRRIFTSGGEIENPAAFSIPLLMGINILTLL